MPRKHLTDRFAKTATTDKQQEEFYDTGFKLRGVAFGLRLSKAGGRDYFIRFRNKAGRKRFKAIGDANTLSLAAAHQEAAKLKTEIDAGRDPSKEKQALKTAPTVEELCQMYYTRYAVKELRLKTHTEYKRIIDVEIVPVLGELKAADVTRRDMRALLDAIEHDRGAPTMSRNVQKVAFIVFGYGVDRELLPHNPCAGLPKRKRTKTRGRALSEDEIFKLWHALDRAPLGMASLYRLLLLLGQRLNETSGMRWSEIEGDVWHLPAERAKNGKPHLIPIPPLGLKILADVKQFNENAKSRSRLEEKDFFDAFVFPAPRTRKSEPQGIQWAGRRFRKLIAALVLDGAMPHCCLHDLRRTAATHLRRLGTDVDTVEKILNHQPQSVLGRSYNQYAGEKEKRQALDRWAKELQRIIAGQSKVIPIRKAS